MSLKHSILALLSRKPKTGYDLSKDSEGSVRFFWSATHQQIYRDLGELERLGWVRYKDVEQGEKPDKKVYSITKDGLNELKRWMHEGSEANPSKDALLIKLFVGDLVSPDVLLKDLLENKERHKDRLTKYREIKNLYFKNPKHLPLERQFQYLTLKRGMGYEESWLKWCKEVETFLEARRG